MNETCPACAGLGADAAPDEDSERLCPGCGHRWRAASNASSRREYYAGLGGRNRLANPGHERKMRDRLATIEPLLRDGQRILEVGCAEGDLGRRIKAIRAVEYVGVELSADAELAQSCLDKVHRVPVEAIDEAAFDLILAFHVLEHIPDVGAELRQWCRRLATEGRLVVEVPNGSGHPLLGRDANPEHLHHFTAASLAALLHRSGLETLTMSTGHFESAVYSDSLRATAGHMPDDAVRRRNLLARFRAVLPEPFVVYGLGGDFRNYVAPLLADLPVAGLADSDTARYGEQIGGRSVGPYDPERFAGLRVLVASLSREVEIVAGLERMRVPRERIVTLGGVYG